MKKIVFFPQSNKTQKVVTQSDDDDDVVVNKQQVEEGGTKEEVSPPQQEEILMDDDDESEEKKEKEKMYEKVDAALQKTNDDSTIEMNEAYQESLHRYFYWKSRYEETSKAMKRKLFQEKIKKKYTDEEYSFLVNNIIVPCIRCKSKEGMHFEKEIFCKKEEKKEVIIKQWPNTYFYRCICGNKSKPCIHIEIYTGEIADFKEIYQANKEKNEYLQREIVLLKLNSMFKYISTNESVEKFEKMKTDYLNSKNVYESCKSTMEILAQPNKKRLEIEKLIKLYEMELRTYCKNYMKSGFHLTNDFEKAVSTEQAIYIESDRLMILKYSSIWIEGSASSIQEEEGLVGGASSTFGRQEEEEEEDTDGFGRQQQQQQQEQRLFKRTASFPPRNCILHSDIPRVVHFHEMDSALIGI